MDVKTLDGRRSAGASALGAALLAVPALFWAVLFGALAGVQPAERLIEGLPDAAQILAAVTCPLVAVMLGCGALRAGRAEHGTAPLLTLAAGIMLFVFALATALGRA
jgi:hypothetical protein